MRLFPLSPKFTMNAMQQHGSRHYKSMRNFSRLRNFTTTLKVNIKKQCLREHRAFKKSVQIWLNVAIAIQTFCGSAQKSMSRAVPDCKPVQHWLKRFFGIPKFYSHNYFDDASVDSNSGTIIQLYVKGQDVLALYDASREALWAHASVCAQGQEYRHTCTHILPSALHFRMPR